jgi:hypothetical protein
MKRGGPRALESGAHGGGAGTHSCGERRNGEVRAVRVDDGVVREAALAANEALELDRADEPEVQGPSPGPAGPDRPRDGERRWLRGSRSRTRTSARRACG